MTPHNREQYFRLRSDTIALLEEVERRKIVHVPAGAVVAVSSDLNGSEQANRQVEARWEGRTVWMFAADILERGEPSASDNDVS